MLQMARYAKHETATTYIFVGERICDGEHWGMHRRFFSVPMAWTGGHTRVLAGALPSQLTLSALSDPRCPAHPRPAQCSC